MSLNRKVTTPVGRSFRPADWFTVAHILWPAGAPSSLLSSHLPVIVLSSSLSWPTRGSAADAADRGHRSREEGRAEGPFPVRVELEVRCVEAGRLGVIAELAA